MIGREEEQKDLLELYNNNKPELIAVFGRRRIGKTFLIQETFKNKFFFKHTGLSLEESDENKKTEIQLEYFRKSLLLYGAENVEKLETWFDAFFELEKLISKKSEDEKVVVFIDELPWLDTKGSNFISAFEGFWNSFGCARNNLKVIVCGSATSWMQNKLINNHGGLYGRVTHEINLYPFNLKECKDFLESKNIKFSNYDITQAYMIFGGVPYYLNYFDSRKSLVQDVNDILFQKNSVLSFEYDRLFNSMFDSPAATKRIVELLFTRKIGYSREEMLKALKLADNGNLSKILNSLVASNFVIKYVPFGLSKKINYYKLIDPFCLFYLNFIDKKKAGENYWINNYLKQDVTSWKGLAFENVCFNHIKQIKESLGIRAVGTEVSSWYYDNESEKGQVDLLLKRNDNIVNLCEIKFYSEDYSVDNTNFMKIHSRCDELCKHLPRKYSVQSTLITTYGLAKNEYWSAFQNVVTLDDLFKF